MNKNLSNPVAGGNDVGPKYWKSLDEVADTPGFRNYLEREFQDGASTLPGVNRRHFVKIMAASFALAGVGLGGCRRPERNILPFAKQPENLIPGQPAFYATSMPLRRQALPLLAQTHDGRPTKIEGNPTYEYGGGKSDLLSQASVLDLYDPDRATSHRSGTARVNREDVFRLLEEIAGRYGSNGGAGLAFLAEQSSSPTRRALVEGLKNRFPEAIWAEYEALDESGADRAASRLLGRSARACYHPGKASRIVSLEADFMNGNGGNLYYARAFARGRRLAEGDKEMNRLYCVESHLTVTGGMADHRLRLSSTFLPAFSARLAAEVLEALGRDQALARQLRQASSGIEQSDAWKERDLEKWIRECAADLAAHPGESLLMPGEHLPEEVQALIFAINIALGNVGSTVEFRRTEEPQAATIRDLAAAIGRDRVKTLFLLGGNPVYDAPADLNWAELQKTVGEVVRYGYYEDESSEQAGHHIAATHYLEAWGDARTLEGTVVPVQPMIQPLFGGINLLELLAVFSDREEREAYALVRRTVTRIGGGGADVFDRFLHDGLLKGTEYPVLNASFDAGRVAEIAGSLDLTPNVPSVRSLEVVFVRDNRIDDGRFVNNGWLQECPDPITKLTWDNAILISPRLADELDLLAPEPLMHVARRYPNAVEQGREVAPVVTLTVNGRSIRGPVHVQPGLANHTVVLPIGYGRTRTGRVGTGAGFSAAPLRTTDHFYVAGGGSIEPTGETYLLASTQDHWSMEGRAIVREANLDHYREEPDFAAHVGMESHAPPSLGAAKDLPIREQVTRTPRGMSTYEHPERTGVNQWGMVIDLNACSGCSACVVACQAENNIPIVGKDQVLRGREMHWMRLDRYFATGAKDDRALAEEPQVVQQPMLCQHCDNAPCEVVCPVNATVQGDEGLNVMVYNRCIGTRYCANNCPYKVRRFNFFDWNRRERDKLYLGPLAPKGMEETLKMQQNPNVTVRMRGVMEKCTFCIQRITSAKVARKVAAGASDDVMVPDGAFQTACQQACPTEAITFGNMMDPESEVVKLKNNPRNYSVLGYLNTRPRLTYLAKVRNPNPKMPDYGSLPLSTVEYRRKNYPEGYHHAEPAEAAGHAGEANPGGRH